MSASSLLTVQADDVLAFWREAGAERWFRKDQAFDEQFRERFQAAHDAAMKGELDSWSATSEGALALLILLDQFPRNCFRGTPRMFESDPLARRIANAALDAGFDQRTDCSLRNFFYLPLMHSEDLADQDRAVALAAKLADDSLRHAVMHRDIVERFGRFPHRNAVLGRTTTPEEKHFLDNGGFGG